MKLKYFVNTPISEIIVRQRVIDFFTRNGYKQQSDSADGNLLFQRGSMWGTLTSFDPRRWACILNLIIKQEAALSSINIAAEISTDPTEKRFAAELLTAEFDLLEAAVTRNEFNTFDAGDLKKRVNHHVAHYVALCAEIMISLFIGGIAGIFAAINLNIAVLGSAAIGAGFMIVTAALFRLILRRQKAPRSGGH
jgi:hypothetical protein